jgi:hypothetical protein
MIASGCETKFGDLASFLATQQFCACRIKNPKTELKVYGLLPAADLIFLVIGEPC